MRIALPLLLLLLTLPACTPVSPTPESPLVPPRATITATDAGNDSTAPYLETAPSTAAPRAEKPSPALPAPQPINNPGESKQNLSESYRVGPGEQLWSIAARSEIYGDPLLWPLLYRANRDQIKAPHQIYPGQLLRIPRHLTPEELTEARTSARKSDVFPLELLLRAPQIQSR